MAGCSVDEKRFDDVFHDEVALSGSVLDTILVKHPEVSSLIDRVGYVLREPDEVRRSVRDSRSLLYYRYMHDVLGGKWIVVVVKNVDRKYVSTIYVTDQVKAGERIWTRPK